MFEYRSDPAGFIEISVAGKITRDEITRAFDRLAAEAAGGRKLKVLERIGDLDGIEPAALWEDIKRGVPMIDKVSHAAVVTDQKWITALTAFSAHFVSAEVRTFGTAQLDEAQRWLAEA